jgi:Ser/Thr protein kinase RdoA (MazF antagonist)
MQQPADILREHWGILDAAIKPIPGGLINQTWKATTKDASYVLQRVSPIFHPESSRDIQVIFDHLARQGARAPLLIPTSAGTLFVPADQGFWRLLTFIPGTVFQTAHSLEVAYAAGHLLGSHHRALSTLTHPLPHARPLRYATKRIFDEFKQALQKTPQRYGLEQQFKTLEALPGLILPGTLPIRITHGDPKINNMIFSVTGDRIEPVALVDFDDYGRAHSTLMDLGDAFRSWCQGPEDDLNNQFSLERFKAALKGYEQGSKGLLDDQERAFIVQATKLISLELATRFATDIIEDSYFGFDSSRYASRRDHNISRFLGQLAIYNDLRNKEEELNQIAQSRNIY